MSLFRLSVRRFCKSIKPDASPDSKYVQPVKGFRKLIAEYLTKFVGSYEDVLSKRFPKAFEVYQVFTVGTRALYTDTVEYLRISRELSYGKDVRSLSYQELLVYYQTPKDLLKVAPTLLVSAAPFANYVVFPLALYFPKQLLSQHFWSKEIRFNYQLEKTKKRLKHNRPIFRYLQFKLSSIPKQLSNSPDIDFKEQCKLIYDKLGSGTHPTVEELLKVSPVFDQQPYGLLHLSKSHLSHLCKMHGITSLPRKVPRLVNYCGLVHELDLAILRLGGSAKLSDNDLKLAANMRGLNPFGCSREELTNWLDNWLYISKALNGTCPSLLLHCPIFLGYNQPSNWKLIYK
ncbi:LETM1 domain-containing protein 1 [Tetranychus urticae]|uniref:Letm1 RBD domain-containing protein n=1 Tax=Tetranychus urticae TaxID=32264 RepID=T1K9X6_TETUR|nr:LETM1 domain-containing protein 1 [Tetranychus urticae]